MSCLLQTVIYKEDVQGRSGEYHIIVSRRSKVQSSPAKKYELSRVSEIEPDTAVKVPLNDIACVTVISK